jgi:hypothetical protein
MRLLHRRQRDDAPPLPVERPEVSRYRQVLAAAPPDVLERLHMTALVALDPLVRATVLRTAQDRLLSGRHLTVDDVPQIAHLVSVGETRTPGIIVSGLEEVALGRLAHAVLRDPEAVGLLDEPELEASPDGPDPPAEPLTGSALSVGT